MADNMKTVAEIVSISGHDFAEGTFSNIFEDTPFLDSLAAVQSTKGSVHQYNRKDAAPIVGYVGTGVGRDFSKTTITPVTETLEMIDASMMVPAVAAKAGGDKDKVLTGELVAHVSAAMFAFEKQLLRGKAGNSAAGFTGFADIIADTANPQFITGGGSTADKQESVYLVFNHTEKGMAPITDEEIEIGSITKVNHKTADNKNAPHYYAPIDGFQGLQQSNNFSVVRIGNLDDSNPLSDTLLGKAMAKFKTGHKANRIVMSSNQQEKLRASRTATSEAGKEADIPTSYQGAAIYTSEALTQNEAVVVAP